MTHADAYELLAAKTSANTDPGLDETELNVLLRSHAVVDRYGIRPDERGWEPTYSLDAAAAEGWRWKAAKVADRFAFSSDAGSFQRDQVHQHCIAMAQHYSSKVVRTLDTAPFADDYTRWGDLLP
jgi:hypothetical protein